MATLNSVHQAKKQCNFDSGWLDQQQGCSHSFFWILWTQETCSVLKQSWKKIYLRTITKWIPLLQPEHGFGQRNEPERGYCRIGIRMKKWWWSSFVWIVDVALQNAWERYHVKKDEGDDSLPFLVFRKHNVNEIFLKYSKTGRLSSSHVRIQNIPSDTCYDDTKYYQVQSEHRRTKNPFKHLRWSVFA